VGFFVIESDFQQYLSTLIDRALAEDLGKAGDITSFAIFSKTDTARAVIKSKASGVLSGAYLLEPLFSRIDTGITLDLLLKDGDPLLKDAIICRLAGPVQGILSGERIALNFLQRLSGIASLTARYVSAIAHTSAVILDTRKTVPGLRPLEKRAVSHGGGMNHRQGLYDMILIKDTHVKRAGGVTPALKKAFTARNESSAPAIEVEVQSIAEFEEALSGAPDRIMLDNMSIADLRTCVDKKNASGASIELEASGSITLESIAAVAETGVDFISCGALTHSAPALDIHLVIT
jgi:nicotinate-nucleotide pyrophosphorylase (carboxylating)